MGAEDRAHVLASIATASSGTAGMKIVTVALADPERSRAGREPDRRTGHST